MVERIQRSRAKGWRMPDGAIYVGRPGPFGNPWLVGDPGILDIEPSRLLLSRPVTPKDAAAQYEAWLDGYAIPRDMMPSGLNRAGRREVWDLLVARREAVFDRLKDLRGHDLACWCRLDHACHADTLIERANRADKP